MYITTVKLQNFRNYENEIINLDKNINIFYGENAQGKTNILEAVFIAAMGKSFRAKKDKELIKFNENNCSIEINFIRNSLEKKIKINFNEKKQITINGIKINKLSQLDLAEKLGVTRQSISYYENGNVEPSINFIIQLSSLFNCSIDSLLFEKHDTDLLNVEVLSNIKKANYLINLNLDIVDSNKIINLLENKKKHLYKTIDDLNDLIIYMKKYNSQNNNNTEFDEELSPSIEFLSLNEKK